MKKKENTGAEGKGRRAKGEGLRAKGKECENAGMKEKEVGSRKSEDNNLSVSQFDNLTNEISTVYNIKKPSAIEFYVPAEGCISESRAVRACLMIRVFNN